MNRFLQKKSFSFFYAALSGFIFIGFLIGLIGLNLFSTTEKDFSDYQTLMMEANPTLGDKLAKPSYCVAQEQCLVRKDIFLNKECGKKHFLLTSRSINLLLNQREGKTELTEEMSNVHCFLQRASDDEQKKNRQSFYYAEADKACFSYKDQTFQAEKVFLRDCEAPGQNLHPEIDTSEPLLTIQASTASFDGKTLSLNGSVFLKHALGTMSADDVIVQESSSPNAKKVATIDMKGNIHVFHADWGTLKNNQSVNVQLVENQGKKELLTIEAKGHSVLIHTEAQKQLSHTLVCEDRIFVDHTNEVVILESPLNANGQVIQEKQVFFYDDLGEAQADKMVVYYKKTDEGMVTHKIVLEGNVYLLDRKAVREDDASGKDVLHYALADKVEYDPFTCEVTLSSNPNKRVLFYDKVNNMQVSSAVLKVLRDQITKKESFKGVGDVRFHFLDSELMQFQKRINFNF